MKYVRAANANKMAVGIDEFAAEIVLEGGSKWQRARLSPTDFQNVEGRPLPDWLDPKTMLLPRLPRQGGIGVPFIGKWSVRIAAGRVDDTTPITAVDLLPTFCEIA